MQVATLIVNPAAGRARRLAACLPAVEALLRRHGYRAEVLETSPAPGSVISLAAGAAARSKLVFACGGDGTVHAVAQGLARTGTPMGVLPLGTHDALARSLGLPPDPLAALSLLLPCAPSLIPLGQIATPADTCFFITMAGCGPSGALAHALAASSRSKARLGRAAYPVQAARLFATRRWPPFEVAWRMPRQATWHKAPAASVLVSRVPSLGGFLGRLTPAASLTARTLHVQLVRPPALLSLPAWFVAAATGLPNPWVEALDVEELRCTLADPASRPVLVQADAEPLGALPCTLTVVPDALNLLLPGRLG